MNIYITLLLGLGSRLALLLYGKWQDDNMAVKFTDIDYQVFTDAAAYMAEGKSPYLRSTYRYTPLLAWMLQPNITLTTIFGKLLFILFDIYTGYLIYQITLSSGLSRRFSTVCAAMWLLNPLPMAVSSRGNAESIMSCLVLLTLKLVKDRQHVFAGMVYAMSVHFKIYPVVYAIPLYLYIDGEGRQFNWRTLLPSKCRVIFIITAAVVFLGLTGFWYHLYGWEFLHHTYLYHVTRKDIRHNFSVYFYLLYQQSAYSDSVLVALVTFVPQFLLLLVFSFKFYQELSLVFFLNTLAFVTFNKVCTSQYFLWYLCILPLLLPHLYQMTKTRIAAVVSLWFAGQGLWLLPAYYLEFEGSNTYLYIWSAGLLFFLINCYIMYTVIDVYVPNRSTSQNTAAGNVRYSKTTKFTKVKLTSQSQSRQLTPSQRHLEGEFEVDYDTRVSLSQASTSPKVTSKTTKSREIKESKNPDGFKVSKSPPRYRLRSKPKT